MIFTLRSEELDMIALVSAAAIGIAALSPALADQTASPAPVLIADGGRAYSGQAVQTAPARPSASAPAPSSSQATPPSQTNATLDQVNKAAKATSDLLGVFGR
jgi:hypothetical protein